MDSQETRQYVEQTWGDSIIPKLVEYIRIPSKSPAFDPECGKRMAIWTRRWHWQIPGARRSRSKV